MIESSNEPDRLPNAPHPRETLALIGHQRQEEALLTALRSGRMHHAWLLGGPEGVGKASFAYRAARFMLAATPRSEPTGMFASMPPCQRAHSPWRSGVFTARRTRSS